MSQKNVRPFVKGTVHAPLVVALHCSGGTGRQWQALWEALDGSATVIAPDLIGTPDAGAWCGRGPFSLAEEAAPVLALIDSGTSPIHLVGHSYGAAVALYVAIQRTHRIVSLTLYEPTAFSLLPDMGPRGAAAYEEIGAVAEAAADGLLSGAYDRAGERFVDYWNGPGSWNTLRPQVKADLVRYLPKACLDFRALFDRQNLLEGFRLLQVPILILQGEHAPTSTALIAERLGEANPFARQVIVAGAGHMGPLTHASQVAATVAEHIRRVKSGLSTEAA